MLEGPGYTTNQLKAVQDWVLQRTLKTVPGVIDVTGYGGTVKQYQVLVDTRLLRQYNVTLKQVEDAIDNSNANVGGDILTLGSQAHNVRAIGLLGGGDGPARPGQRRRRPTRSWPRSSTTSTTSSSPRPTASRSTSGRSPRSSSSHRPRLGIVGRRLKEKDGERVAIDEDDVIEGIVLMRKYEKSLVTANLVEEKLEGDPDVGHPAQGDEHPGLQPADRPGPRHDPQRAAQPGRGHDPGGRRSCSSSWATWPAPGSWRS